MTTGLPPAVRVELNPTQLSSYGLGLQDVSNMLSQQNAIIPKGQLSNERLTADILTNDQLMQASDYKNLTVGYDNGAAIRLSDVADAARSVQNVRVTGFPTRSARCRCGFPPAGRESDRHRGANP